MVTTLKLLAGANFAAACSGMVIAGLLQLIARDLDWQPAQAGHLVTTYALGFAIGAPVLGAVFGSYCRKKTVVLGLALVATGGALTAWAPGSPWIEAARLLVAAGAALTLPSTSAIAAYLHPEDRAAALAQVLVGLTLAVVLGVPLGTLLAEHLGWRSTVLAAALLAALASAVMQLALPGGIVVPPVPLQAWRNLLADMRMLPLFLVTLVVVAGSFSVYAFIAVFVAAMAGLGAQGLSGLLFLYGLASLAASLVLGRMVGAIGELRLLMVSLVTLALALAALGQTAHKPALLAGLFVAWAVAGSIIGTLQQSRIVAAAPTLGPASLALNTSASFAGQALGTIGGGLVLSAFGIGGLPWLAAGLVATATVLLAVTGMASRRTRESRG